MPEETETDQSYKLWSGPENKGDNDLLNRSDVQNRRQRIQALLSQWLRMENIVVLMGAGCSCSQGGKSLGELDKAVIEYLMQLYGNTGEGGENSETTPCKIVSQRKESGHTQEAPGFEQWLSIIANTAYLLDYSSSPVGSMHWNGVGEVSSDDLQKVLDDCRRAIMGLCGLRLPRFTPEPTGHHALVGKLIARDPSLGRVNLFTTNYDTLIEQALDDLGIQYFDGFAGRVRPRFDPSIYGIDVYYPGEVTEGRVRRFDKFSFLYKLHGSISWRYNEERNEIV